MSVGVWKAVAGFVPAYAHRFEGLFFAEWEAGAYTP